MAKAVPTKTLAASRVNEIPPPEVIFGSSATMLAVRQRVEKVANASIPILIQGDSGSGKGVLAAYIHSISNVASAPFVKVNCAAIPGSLLESELFGFEKGAFTGAHASKPGRVELANGGTLFLDGIDEIDMSLQAKMLQLLQDGQFSRIGGQEDCRVNVRVICATGRSLEDQIAKGLFRADLFYRINVVNLQLPSLRSRAQDIRTLVSYFLQVHCLRHKIQRNPISSAAMRLIERHPWPGNIRELENLIERYVILGSEDAISVELLKGTHSNTLPETLGGGQIHLKQLTQKAVHELEHKIILSVLEANHWNRKKTAVDLRISYRGLLYKIRRAGLPSKRHTPVRPAFPAAAVAQAEQ
jgi:two-component system response regulator AtoC